MQLITIYAVVKSKCAVEKGKRCTKKCRDSGKNDDLYADYKVLCSCNSLLKKNMPCALYTCRIICMIAIDRAEQSAETVIDIQSDVVSDSDALTCVSYSSTIQITRLDKITRL